MCKKMMVLISGVLLLVLVGSASAEVVDGFKEWNSQIQLNTIGGLQITGTGHAKFTARVDHDMCDVTIAAGGILETNDTYKLPNDDGPSNVYVDGTWNAHDIESFGLERDSRIYMNANGEINLATGLNGSGPNQNYDPLDWLAEGSLLVDPSLVGEWAIEIEDMGGGASRITGLSPDSDGDGINNDQDNCPDVANPDQADGDRMVSVMCATTALTLRILTR